LSDTPVGPATLFVQDPRDEDKLVREKSCFNFTEGEEGAVVQYLVAGGHSQYTLASCPKTSPSLVCSSFHAGPGQPVFGCGPTQRCDLLMIFYPVDHHNHNVDVDDDTRDNTGSSSSNDRPVYLEYHNYHGSYRHYEGHVDSCPFEDVPYRPTDVSSLFDKFRTQLAEAFSRVNPRRVLFHYSVSTTCDYEHGAKQVPSLNLNNADNVDGRQTHYASIRELISDKFGSSTLPVGCTNLACSKPFWTGFVTLVGGKENTELVRAHLSNGEPNAGENFGFCVQNFAPPLHLLSPHTRQQIIDYFGWADSDEDGGIAKLGKFLSDLAPRTLNSSTFHAEETICTAYLKWLVEARGFHGFTISHFMHYKFADYNRDYLEPLLQKHHEFKRTGQVVGAECAKLLGNGDFGYKGLEACNYDDTRLMTDASFHANRKKSLLHVSLKHVSLIGIVRTKVKPLRSRRRRSAFVKQKRSVRRVPPAGSEFLFDKAAESGDEPTSEIDFEMEEEENSQLDDLIRPAEDEIFANPDPDDRGLSESEGSTIAGSSNDCDDDDETDDSSSGKGNSDSDDLNFESYDPTVVDRQQAAVLSNDLDDMLVCTVERRAQQQEEEPLPGCSTLVARKRQCRLIQEEHLYACSSRTAAAVKSKKAKRTKLVNIFLKKQGGSQKAQSRYKFNFLLSVVKSGEQKQIKNFLPGAVSILSNSKKLFLDHINAMLKCLDSGLAELTYIDTDSVLFSTTYPDLNDCIRPELKELWLEADVLADQTSELSVHGKMKLEGTFRLGHFKTLKIYRLFNEDEAAGFVQAYTQCKGVNRRVALRLPDLAFDSEDLSRIVVHRTALRPTRTGEMTLANEAKTLARPFNLKRFTTLDSIHTLPISFLSDHPLVDENDDDDDDDDDDEA
jgi:hypothetical protein